MAPTTLDRRRRPDPRAEVGRVGERAALEVYRRMGFRVIARNWRCPAGEIDLVVRRGSLLVICEVKTRSSRSFGEGYESVTFAKRRRLRRLAQSFVHAAGLEALNVRFDVASVALHRDERPDVIVFTDAF